MSTTITRILPPINVRTPIGDGWALFMIDYGHDWNTCWVVQLYETGQIKHIDSNDIRVGGNATYGIGHPKQPAGDPRPGN